jgi:hypothetical protein
MKSVRWAFVAVLLAAGLGVVLWYGPLTSAESRRLGSEVSRLADRLESGAACSMELEVTGVAGLPGELVGHGASLQFRQPDRLRITAAIDGQDLSLSRAGDEVRLVLPQKKLALAGRNGVPRFSSDPDSVTTVDLPDLTLPVPRWQLALLPALLDVEPRGKDEGWLSCRPRDLLRRRAGLPEDFLLSLRREDSGRLAGIEAETGGKRITLAIDSFSWPAAEPDWIPDPGPEVKVETVALSHLERFVRVAVGNLGKTLPVLPAADGSRSVVARHGRGRLERIDGTRVLFLEGTPGEMGEQHGVLLRDEVRHLVDRIVYGVGVGSSFGKGRWFFGEIEEAQSRLEPFTDPRHLREMDALASAAGLHPQEARLANFFPELFHCSGFALHGTATVGGRMYHGRILDYLRGLGLEENAVVMVVKPDEGNAWVNVGYAGFIGTVTAMNEKQVAVGEMGGRGEGNWDGKAMAQLLREVMERADTIDEAVAILRQGPRTCEYYYVVSDAKTRRAVGIKATPELFETVWSGESHPQLSRPVKDTVLMSAGDRYEALVDRVEAGFGTFDADAARALMDPPVCMNSNIQSVLFAPDTLDFWVANADSENVASRTRYTKYNLRELLDAESGLTKR